MNHRSLAVLGAATIVAALSSAAPAHAAQFTCESSALTAQLLTAPAIEPITANRGATQCATRRGGLAGVLPAPLATSALFAETNLTGSGAAQVATASAGIADARVLPLPDLGLQQRIDQLVSQLPPVTVPLPLPAVPLAGTTLPSQVSLDIRQALAGILTPQAEVLRLQVAAAFTKASCNGSKLQLDGSSRVAGLSVLGKELPTDEASTQAINVLGQGSVNLGQLDITKIVPQGIAPELVTTVQNLLKPTLAQVNVPIPELLASVRITPAAQTRTTTSLTQTALGVNIAIAGQQILDLRLGRATVGASGTGCAVAGGAAQQALQCTKRNLVLTDVFQQGNRVRLVGAANRKFIGRTVSIFFVGPRGGGPRVARAKVRSDGSFLTRAKLPPRKIRSTNRARYQARLGKDRSLRLKLQRRMIVRSVKVRGGRVRILGRVTRPLASPIRSIEVRRRVSCKRYVLVKRIRPRADGTFTTTVAAPPKTLAATYRFATRVRKTRSNPKTYPTFTLPRYVDLT